MKLTEQQKERIKWVLTEHVDVRIACANGIRYEEFIRDVAAAIARAIERAKREERERAERGIQL